MRNWIQLKLICKKLPDEEFFGVKKIFFLRMLISIKPWSWSKFTLKRIKSQLLPISLFLSYIFPSWIRIQFQSPRYKVLKIWALNVKLRYYSNRRSHKTVDFIFIFFYLTRKPWQLQNFEFRFLEKPTWETQKETFELSLLSYCPFKDGI